MLGAVAVGAVENGAGWTDFDCAVLNVASTRVNDGLCNEASGIERAVKNGDWLLIFIKEDGQTGDSDLSMVCNTLCRNTLT